MLNKEKDNNYSKRKGFWAITISVLTVCSAIVSIVNGLEQTINWLSSFLGFMLSYVLVYSNIYILLPIGIIVVIVTSVKYLTTYYRKKFGTREIPCTVISLFHFKIQNRNSKLLQSIHRDIYHSFYKLKDDIHMHRIDSIADINKGIEDLLFDIHTAIDKSFGLDLTISVKKLILDRDDNLCLIPFVHYRNIAERDLQNPRAFNYTYYVEADEYERLQKYTSRAKQYHNSKGENRKYEVNNVFTYLITHKARFWMSNNLLEDEKSNNFYTTSDNYPEYYKSIAVFSIAPPEKNVLPEGLIIFDSQNIGRFSEKECVNMFGYIAHLFYELLIEYNNYESKKK